jgi:hypothetical protein
VSCHDRTQTFSLSLTKKAKQQVYLFPFSSLEKRKIICFLVTMSKSSDKIPTKKASSTKKTSTCTASELLGVIAQVAVLHGGKAPRDLVAKRAGYGTADNDSFKKALSRAAKKGLLDRSDKRVLDLTDKGREEAGDAPPVKTNEDAHNKIKEELSDKMQEAFALMTDGKAHTREELASAMKYPDIKHQGFRKLLDRIKGKGYLDYVDKDTVRLSDVCFPQGRDE